MPDKSRPANSRTTRTSASVTTQTVAQLIRLGAQRFTQARLWFGHGSDNAADEAAELVLFGAGLKHEDAPAIYGQVLSEAQRTRVLSLFDRRIAERVPAAYLTNRMWFAGHEFFVDARVLVPRSAIAELIDRRFEPWIDAQRIATVLDIGTGSGCIAIATALALPDARVDAADISTDALAVTAINIERHGLQDRVRGVPSDVFSGVSDRRYDVIVSNPPYVGSEEMAGLPQEYHCEPVVGLFGGSTGLDIVRRILVEAADHLQPRGVLIVEVGNSADALEQTYPEAPFVWLEFERGDGGVFVLTAEQLTAYHDYFAAGSAA